jgi:Zn-dependent protease/CBS domain-containing protein
MGGSAGLRIGRIAGVEIIVDLSLLIIFLLIAFSLAMGVFPAWHPDWSAGLHWATALGAAVLFFVSVLLHELAHAVVGRKGGVEINRITLFMFGGMAHMENEPPSWRAELVMALAGPLTSLALGILFGVLAAIAAGQVEIDPANPALGFAALGPIPTLLAWLAPVNIILGIFNLVPGFPLDGGRVLRAIMWAATGDFVVATRRASRAGQFIAWVLMALGLLMILGLQVPFFGTGLLSGLWLAFIGWFLNNAALASYRQLLVRESLENVPVERLMQTQFRRVDPGMPVKTLVDEHLMSSGQRAFPVEQDGRFLGLVCIHDLQRRGRDTWGSSTVGEIMTPARELTAVSPREDALDALALLGRRDVNQLPVVDNGRLVGMIRLEDILKWLSLRGGPGRENKREAQRYAVGVRREE